MCKDSHRLIRLLNKNSIQNNTILHCTSLKKMSHSMTHFAIYLTIFEHLENLIF